MQIRVFTDAVRVGAIPHKVIRVQHRGAFLVFAAHQAEDLISVFDLNRVHDRKIHRSDLDICFSDRGLAVRTDSLTTGHMNLGIALDGQAAFCKEFIAIITVARIDCISFVAACIFADRFDFSAVQNHRSHRGDGDPIFTLCINFNIVERQAVPDIYTVILTDCLQLAAGHFHRTVRADAIVVAACINVSIGNA